MAGLTYEVSEAIRKQFKCVDCGADAYFNKGSWRQAAHFAERHHTDHCGEARRSEGGSDPKVVNANNLIILSGAEPPSTNVGLGITGGTQSSKRTILSAASGTAETTVRRGVSAVLRELILDEEFATAQKNIIVGNTVVPATEFSVCRSLSSKRGMLTAL